jgi:hypothetical protein
VRKLPIALLTLVVLFCGAFALPNHTAVTKATTMTQEEYPDYINVVPLFEDNLEENLMQIPAGKRWHWFGQRYLPCEIGVLGTCNEPINTELYSGYADYPDCYWLRPIDALYPPNNPEIFELAE